MLKLPEIDPSQDLLEQLKRWQDDIDGQPDYPARVAKAKTAWQSHRNSQTMQDVALLLEQMCCGGRRCAYCEDSLADEIEHIWPKSLYPALVFDWLNYLYACGPCNRKKGSSLAVYPATSGTWQYVSRKKDDPVIEPPSGEMVFINPRSEDPTRFFMLDLRDTFRLEPLPRLGARARERADYTKDNLPINDSALCLERENEYGNYRARLNEYSVAKRRGASPSQQEHHKDSLLRLRHQTVWFEMKRQQARIPELTELFAQAPEALIW
jgi:uncharacterized protein (TIGR02646 family)